MLLAIYLFSIFTGVAIGWLRFNRLTTPYRLLTGLLTYTLISEIISESVLKHLESPVYKNFNYTLYSFVFISLISLFQYKTSADKRFKQIIVTQYFIVVTYILINSLYKGLYRFPSTQLIVLSFSLIILSLYRLSELAEKATEVAITSIPDFYVSSAYLTFFLMSITMWVQKNYFPDTSEGATVFFDWFFNLVCYTSYFVLAYALHLNYKNNSKKANKFG